MVELHHLSALEQLDRLRRGEVAPAELTDHYLDRIESLNDGLGAFVTVTPESARRRARHISTDVSRAAPLWGLPHGDKDLSRRAGVRTTFGSRLFENLVPDESDEIVRVLDAAGAVSLGKTNTPEFGLHAYTRSSVAAPARNPWNSLLGAGGSSGGAAVAVASGMLPVAVGSDGGGSIRIPAAATGLVGLKPSRGRVPSMSGFASLGGLAVAGPIARSVADAALVLDAISGPSPFATGPTTWNGGAWLNAAVRGEGRFQLGVMTTSPWDASYDIRIAPEATTALEFAMRELDALGHGIEEYRLGKSHGFADAFRTLWRAGAASIPADGAELERLEPITRWLVEEGRSIGARELTGALGELTAFERDIIRQFAAFDAVLTPTLALMPRPTDWYSNDDAELNFAQQVQYTPWTSMINASGLPAITLPVSMTDDGLPMGVQLIGRPGGEHVLLAIGAQLERRLNWQSRHPPMW